MRKHFLLVVAVMFCACGKRDMEKAKGLTFLIYPAIEGAAGNKDCEDFLGRCMLFQTDKPLFQLRDFGYKPLPRISAAAHDRIELFLSARQSADFESIPKRYIGEGKRLALVHSGKIIHAPKLKAPIKAASLTIDFCNANVYKAVLASLRGEKLPGYKFDDTSWNTCDTVGEN